MYSHCQKYSNLIKNELQIIKDHFLPGGGRLFVGGTRMF